MDFDKNFSQNFYLFVLIIQSKSKSNSVKQKTQLLIRFQYYSLFTFISIATEVSRINKYYAFFHHSGLTMEHQCDITNEFEKLSIPPEEKQSDDAHSMFLLFKPKVLNANRKIRESKKCPDNDSILDYIIKIEASNVDKLLSFVLRTS